MLETRIVPLSVAVVAAALSLAGVADAAEPTRPNIVHLFADDLGFGGVGFTNPDTYVETPNLDRLASGGMILDRSYASSLCSPSRANLLTGFHNGPRLQRPQRDLTDGLRAQAVTTGEVLQGAGTAPASSASGAGVPRARATTARPPIPGRRCVTTLPATCPTGRGTTTSSAT